MVGRLERAKAHFHVVTCDVSSRTQTHLALTHSHTLTRARTHTHLAGPLAEQQGVEGANSAGFQPQCPLSQTGEPTHMQLYIFYMLLFFSFFLSTETLIPSKQVT